MPPIHHTPHQLIPRQLIPHQPTQAAEVQGAPSVPARPGVPAAPGTRDQVETWVNEGGAGDDVPG